MKLYCTACNSEVPAANIDLTGKVAKCQHCNNVFSFAGKVSYESQAAQERLPIGIPKGFQIQRSVEGFQIVRSWFTAAIIPLTFFCLFWNGFMAVWFYIAISQKTYVMALFGILHGAVGLGMLYATIAGYLNKTYITIAYDSVSILHKPLPSLGQKKIPRQELKQLYSKDSMYHGKHGREHHSFSVQALTRQGQVIEFISGLQTSEEALYIEQEVEKYLGIKDESVRGELPRS